MLRIFVAEEKTAEQYEEWLADLMRAEEKHVLDLVRVEMPHYGEYFSHENFTQTLLLRQQSYKEKCDSKVIELIRERRVAHADASSPLEPTASSGHSVTTNPNADEISSGCDTAQASDITSSLADPEGTTIDAHGNEWLRYKARFDAVNRWRRWRPGPIHCIFLWTSRARSGSRGMQPSSDSMSWQKLNTDSGWLAAFRTKHFPPDCLNCASKS